MSNEKDRISKREENRGRTPLVLGLFAEVKLKYVN